MCMNRDIVRSFQCTECYHNRPRKIKIILVDVCNQNDAIALWLDVVWKALINFFGHCVIEDYTVNLLQPRCNNNHAE